MSERDNERFRVRPGAPRARPTRYVSRVLKEVSKAGAATSRASFGRPGARLGRGHAAARFAGRALHASSRRVSIKTRLVNLRTAGPRATLAHLRYIERDGVARDGERTSAYGPLADSADVSTFEERGRGDRHQFRFIIAPEDAVEIEDLRTYTRSLMSRMEADLGSRLEWVAADHWDTDNPHTHVVLRGKDESGRDLIIAGEYIAHGMRQRASDLATQWLGPRTQLEIRQSLVREVDQERWTSLDRALHGQIADGAIRLDPRNTEAATSQRRALLLGRLQRLQVMGLARESSPGAWTLRSDAESVLRAQGERGDILRTMQRAMGGIRRELVIGEPADASRPVIGKVVAKGLSDARDDGSYLVVDGTDGRAHYVRLRSDADLEQFPIGGIVHARAVKDRLSDKTIAALASDGLYRTHHHEKALRGGHVLARDPGDVVAAHVRRLEALRRAGIVERVTEGVWKIPADLPERGQRYDAGRIGDTVVELRSHLPVERQVRAIGATWLDRQLLDGTQSVSEGGFGRDVHDALRRRTDYLVELGLADQRSGRVVFSRHLLATLRNRDIEVAATAISAETGLVHRAVSDGVRAAGVYRRNVLLASGRFAMLDDGIGFSLVPWRAVIEHRLGQAMTAVTHAGVVSWTFGKSRGVGPD